MAVRHKGQGTRDKGDAHSDWSAPQEDGGLLIWPAPPRVIELVRQNTQFLAKQGVALNGVPLGELRSMARRLVGHTAGPLIATGHQCELQHPGVWIKNAVTCAAADTSGGAALHIAVDTDAPKHLKLKWPGFSASITDDPRAGNAAWSGLLEPPTPAHLEHLMREAEAARGEGRVSQLLVRFLQWFGAAQKEQGRGGATPRLSEALLVAQQALDQELGLHYGALPLARLLDSEPWGDFVCALANDARNLANVYNASLEDYRRERGIDSSERPAPDLLITRNRVEIPFWLDELATGRRHRAELFADGAALSLPAPAGGGSFAFGASVSPPMGLLVWLQERQLRLAPRALSLTMFLRVCVCDLFVHGIGGGLYDRVTDRIIRHWLGIDPPAFAVATATLYHAFAEGRERVDIAALRQEQHRQAHNALGEAKWQWLERVRVTREPHERRRIFEQMHSARRQAMTHNPTCLHGQRRLSEAQEQVTTEAEIFDRELFYAIQPAARLSGLIDRVGREFGLRC